MASDAVLCEQRSNLTIKVNCVRAGVANSVTKADEQDQQGQNFDNRCLWNARHSLQNPICNPRLFQASVPHFASHVLYHDPLALQHLLHIQFANRLLSLTSMIEEKLTTAQHAPNQIFQQLPMLLTFNSCNIGKQLL